MFGGVAIRPRQSCWRTFFGVMSQRAPPKALVLCERSDPTNLRGMFRAFVRQGARARGRTTKSTGFIPDRPKPSIIHDISDVFTFESLKRCVYWHAPRNLTLFVALSHVAACALRCDSKRFMGFRQ